MTRDSNEGNSLIVICRGDRLSFLPGTRDSEFVAQCIPQGHNNYCAKIRLNSVTCTNTNKNSKALPTWVCDFDHTNMDPYSWESYNIRMSNERIVCDNSRSSPLDKDDNKDDVCTPCLLKYFVEPITVWDSSLGKVFNNAIAVGAHIGSYSFYAVLFFIAMALISILIVILQDICGNINFPTFRLEGLVNLLQRLSPLTYQPRYRRRRRKLKLRNIDTDSDSESDEKFTVKDEVEDIALELGRIIKKAHKNGIDYHKSFQPLPSRKKYPNKINTPLSKKKPHTPKYKNKSRSNSGVLDINC